MQPTSMNQTVTTTTNPENNFGKECKSISTDRLFNNYIVALVGFLVPIVPSLTFAGIMATATDYGAGYIISGALGIYVAFGAISCTAVQYFQNRVNVCRNPNLEHQKHCPRRIANNIKIV